MPINPLTRISDVIIDAGMVLGFFMAIVLVTNKNRNRKSNRILASLLVLLSINIAHYIFLADQFDVPNKVKEPFLLAIGPVLLFYFRESTGLGKFRARDLVHFLPLILFFVVMVPLAIAGPAVPWSEFFVRNSVGVTRFIWMFIVIQYAFYWWTVVHLFRKHIAAIESEFSNTEGKTFSWMKTFFHVFGVFLALLTITIPIILHSGNYVLVITLVECGISVTIFVLGYEGLFQEEIFSNVRLAAVDGTGQVSPQETTDVPDNAQDVRKFVPALLTYLDEKKPYLDEELTLTNLAQQVGMTRNQLSTVINTGIGDSFYTFINKYRVEEAKRLIADPKNAAFTILTLAYQAGFPSKSSFHNVFKKITGLTPTEYRNTLLQK